CRHELANAAAPFTGANRFRPLQRIDTGARMRIDDPECARLQQEVHDDAGEDDVLEDVGKVAGMEGVAIVHPHPAATRDVHGSRGPASRRISDWRPPPRQPLYLTSPDLRNVGDPGRS